jgi:hypothetical protein
MANFYPQTSSKKFQSRIINLSQPAQPDLLNPQISKTVELVDLDTMGTPVLVPAPAPTLMPSPVQPGPATTSSSRPSPNPPPDVYEVANYERDAALVLVLNKKIEQGGFPYLQGLIRNSDIREACIILVLVDKHKRIELREQAIASMHYHNTSTSNPVTFLRFLVRFRNGPVDFNGIETEVVNPAVNQSGRSRPKPAKERGRRPSESVEDIRRPLSLPRGTRPLYREQERRDPERDHDRRTKSRSRSRHWKSRNLHRRRDSSTSESSSSFSLEDEYDHRRRYDRSPGKWRKAHHHHNRKDRRELYTSRDHREQSTLSISARSQIKLNAKDVQFDGLPTSPITPYVNRLEYLAATYGDSAVLAVLPLGMTGDAQIWFDSLLNHTRKRMTSSLKEWVVQLRARFQANASVALKEADELTHSFAEESKFNVHQYITKKTQLYSEAGEVNEDLIVQRLHGGLDPTLAVAVQLSSFQNTVAEFNMKVYAAEPSTRARFRQFEEMLGGRERQSRSRSDNRKSGTIFGDYSY